MRRFDAVLGACLVVLCAGLACGAGEGAPGKGLPKGTIAHSVYFWLKEEATEKDVATLIEDCKGLAKLDCVLAVHAGTPLGKGRGAVDSSYQVGIVVYFPDKAAYEKYLPHPKHQALVKKHKELWTKVVVYDFVMQ